MGKTLVGLVSLVAGGVIALGVAGTLNALDERVDFGSGFGWGRGQGVDQVYQTAPPSRDSADPRRYERAFTLISSAIPVDSACLERTLSADGGQVLNVQLNVVDGKVVSFNYVLAKEGGGLREAREYLRRLAAECQP